MTSPTVDFGQYELLERLAVGGMAEIYRARFHAVAGVTRPVVIKKILPAFADSRAFVQMFVNEARIAVSLTHGNVAQVFDFGEVGGEYFLAMEYVHGQPLSRVLRRAQALQFPVLPAPVALQIAVAVCRGLHYAHTRLDEKGEPLLIVHHDVSPQNVLVGYAGDVKIVDFGIARARATADTATQETGVKGKYPYFSPEQARGETVDRRTDIYATGVVLYQMLCGRLPHQGALVKAMQSIVRGEFPAPRTLNPGITPSLERIVLRAMAYRPEDRFASADEMAEALSAELHAAGPRPTSVGEFMGFLFEPELIAEGHEPRHPRALLEQVPGWRRGARSTPPAEPVPSHTTVPVARPIPRRWRTLAVAGPALIAGALLALPLLRPPTFAVAVTSEPAGAAVELDGRTVPGATPLRLERLGVDRRHALTLRLPGRAPWTGEVTGRAGATLEVRATLPPEGVAPAPSPGP